MLVPFNMPPYTKNEEKYLLESLHSNKMSGGGPFTIKCEDWFESSLKSKKVLLTTSCTHALEIAALLVDIREGDEVIMPSYTFVSTANAFVLRGAKIVFVDINPKTMNIDETKIEMAITKRTKVIVPVHYAGVGCEMNTIMQIAQKYKLFVIEDAAQGIESTYNGRPLGTIGHLGTFSFHETKNITSAGEGGLLIINDESFIQRAEIIREKGTNRSQFFRGMVDKYSWVDLGSSYLLSDMSAAYLWGQLEVVESITSQRLTTWNTYFEGLKDLIDIELQTIPEGVKHNAHMFYLKVKDQLLRDKLIRYLREREVESVFHYVPLHSSFAGKKYGYFSGVDTFTTIESERILRLPLFYGITQEEIYKTISLIKSFFDEDK